MQTLRNARLLTRLVLVWFALFIGASVAAPLVHPQTSQMVCSVMGMKLVTSDDDAGGNAQPSASMDCPLCAPVAAPPSPSAGHFDVSSALAYALRPMAAAHIIWLAGAPLPPRGPPAFS